MNYWKLYISVFLFVAATGFSFSQQQEMEDGYHVFKYPNGTVSSEGNIRDGKPDGYWKSYYVTGVLNLKEREETFFLTVYGYFILRPEILLKK